jgi:hypothetical protein
MTINAPAAAGTSPFSTAIEHCEIAGWRRHRKRTTLLDHRASQASPAFRFTLPQPGISEVQVAPSR